MYHRIAARRGRGEPRGFGVEVGLPVDVFESQLRFLLKHFRPVRAADLATQIEPLGGPVFAVTFDDGYEDNLTLAAPVLERLGIHATIFLTTEFIGTDRRFWWEQLGALLRETNTPRLRVDPVAPGLRQRWEMPASLPLSSYAERERAHWLLSMALMRTPPSEIDAILDDFAEDLGVRLRSHGRDVPLLNWDQARQLRRRGFDLGAHGLSHANLALAVDVEREVCASVKRVAAEVDSPVETFAYPYGRPEQRSDLAIRAVEAAGCRGAYTSELGVVRPDSDIWALPRMGLTRGWGFACAYQTDRAFRASAAVD